MNNRLSKIFKKIVIAGFVIGNILFGFSIARAEVQIDNLVSGVNNRFNHSSPTIVWINDTEGFTFYSESDNGIAMASTTDSGATWGNIQTVDSSNTDDAINLAVWYDQWTPGDTTGTLIHIVTIDSGDDDTWYTEYNTITNKLSTTVVTGVESATLSASANAPTITKAEDGDLYIAEVDGADSWVHTCSTTCTSGGNWSAITNPITENGNDFPLLMPLAGTDNILYMQWDLSATIAQSNIYSATSSTWWGWIVVDSDARADSTYDSSIIGATINRSTGEIYFVDIHDNGTEYDVEDHDIYIWEFDNSTFVWTQGTDVITDASGGLTHVKIGLDENTGDLYVVYVRRTTIETSTTGNVYYQVSNDNGSTWNGEVGPLNVTPDNIRGLSINAMSANRLGVRWKYPNSPNEDVLYYSDVADIGSAELSQAAYRWFTNDNAVLPSRAGALNTPAVATTSTDYLRLRLLLHVSEADLSSSGTTTKLQYAERSGTCDTSFSGETYIDITSGSAIRYYDNPTPSDNATLTSHKQDPRHGANSGYKGADLIVNQTYNDGDTDNIFGNSVAGISSGSDGLWDFSLTFATVTPGTSYCIRAVQSEGGVLGDYSVISEFRAQGLEHVRLRGQIRLRTVRLR